MSTTNVTQGIKHGPSFPIEKSSRASWSLAGKIRHHFPTVKILCDAMQPVRIDVGDTDRTAAEPQEHTQCAFAKAACRMFKADGAFIGINTSYLVFGEKAIRFLTPASVAREIVTFDRHQDFSTGIYRLAAVCPSQRLGVANIKKGGKKKGPNKNKLPLVSHRTTRIRGD